MSLPAVITRAIHPAIILGLTGGSNQAPTFKAGLDVARYGSAHNVLWLRHDDWIFGVCRWNGVDTWESATILTSMIKEWEEYGWICLQVCIDVIGIGAGVVDNAWHASERHKHLIKPINCAMKSSEPLRFDNVRSELAWNLRKKFRGFEIRFLPEQKLESGEKVGIPDFMLEKVKSQATTLAYKSDERVSGKIVVESKKEYITRVQGAASPDEFDALALTFNDKLVGLEQRPGVSMIGSIVAR